MRVNVETQCDESSFIGLLIFYSLIEYGLDLVVLWNFDIFMLIILNATLFAYVSYLIVVALSICNLVCGFVR